MAMAETQHLTFERGEHGLFEDIRSFTEEVARGLKEALAGRPQEEAEAWIRAAHQREARVCAIYETDAFRTHMMKLGSTPPLHDLVRGAVGCIWAQEVSHAALVRSLRSLDDA